MKAKRCSKCGVEKEAEAFGRRGDRLLSTCRECKRAYEREIYRTNPARRAAVAAYRAQYISEPNRRFLEAYLRSHPCVDCGESDPAVLEFDHVRGEKLTEVSRLLSGALANLAAEVAKCDVRCGNCHRRKTARDFNWWIWRARKRPRQGGEGP